MFEIADAYTADTIRHVLVGATVQLGVGRWRVQCRSDDLRASQRVGIGVVFVLTDARSPCNRQNRPSVAGDTKRGRSCANSAQWQRN